MLLHKLCTDISTNTKRQSIILNRWHSRIIFLFYVHPLLYPYPCFSRATIERSQAYLAVIWLTQLLDWPPLVPYMHASLSFQSYPSLSYTWILSYTLSTSTLWDSSSNFSSWYLLYQEFVSSFNNPTATSLLYAPLKSQVLPRVCT